MKSNMTLPAVILGLAMVISSIILAHGLYRHGLFVRQAGQYARPDVTIPTKHEVVLYSDSQTRHGPVKVRMID